MKWHEFEVECTSCGMRRREEERTRRNGEEEAHLVRLGVAIESALDAAKFLHKIGTIMYFNQTRSHLNNLVVLDPKWLSGIFGR